jgi:hypothetical protein
MKAALQLVGSISLAYGVLVFFSDSYVEKLRKVWSRNETSLDRRLFPGQRGYFISRYVSSVGFIGIGIVLLSLAYSLLGS